MCFPSESTKEIVIKFSIGCLLQMLTEKFKFESGCLIQAQIYMMLKSNLSRIF
jgi:hypothetical protein